MGKVLTSMRVFQDDGVDQNALIDKLKSLNGFNTAKLEDYVFGTKVIRASFVCEDGEAVDFEELVRGVEGVSEVQVDEVGLI